MNEQNSPLEQRITALESLAIQATGLLLWNSTAVTDLTELSLHLKKDLTSLTSAQGDVLQLMLRFAPGIDEKLKTEITTLVRRLESSIDQAQAREADLQKRVDTLKQQMRPFLPPQNSPAA